MGVIVFAETKSVHKQLQRGWRQRGWVTVRQKSKFEVKVASCKEKEGMASRSQIDCQLIELHAPELRDVQICVLLYIKLFKLPVRQFLEHTFFLFYVS